MFSFIVTVSIPEGVSYDAEDMTGGVGVFGVMGGVSVGGIVVVLYDSVIVEFVVVLSQMSVIVVIVTVRGYDMVSNVARSALLSFNSMESFEGCDGLATGIIVVELSLVNMLPDDDIGSMRSSSFIASVLFVV